VTLKVAVLRGPTAVGMVKLMEDAAAMLGEGVTADIQVVDSPDLLSSKIVSREVDLATPPTNMAATLYNKGIPYQLAAITSWGVNYLVTADPTVNTLADLKGKTVNVVGKGATPDIVLRYLLRRQGLDPDKDLTLDYTLGQVELAQSLIAGRSQVAVMPEPWVTQALMGNQQLKVAVNLQDAWAEAQQGKVQMAQTCLIVNREVAQAHPQAVAAFLDAYRQSLEWVTAHPGEAGALVEKHGIGMKAAVAEAAIPRCNFRFEDAASSRQAVEAFLKVLFDFAPASVGGKMPDDGFYYAP
jgi:NitT/TauT family transport system substrate-binding protein